MKRFSLRYKLLVLTVIAMGVWTLAADLPFSFKAGEVISAEQMNQNFATLNTAKQERVEGECAEGSSIRVIGADGKVTCETDDVGANGVGYTAGTGLNLTGTEFSIDAKETQVRVEATCAAGSSIRTIGEDGKVSCEVDDVGSGGGNAGVDSLNGMTGAVTLQAGDNITIDDSQAGQLTISAKAGGGGSGDVTGVATGTGLSGGGSEGDLTLSLAQSYRLPQSCKNGQIAEWDGSKWLCADDDVGTGGGGGDITAVTAGDGLTGGGESGSVSLKVSFAGSGSAKTVARSDHEHFGQTWTGEDPETPGLTVVNTAPDNDGPTAIVGRVGLASDSLGLNAIGVWGEVPSGAGVAGSSPDGYGIYGFSLNNRGVFGESSSNIGVFGTSSSNIGVVGSSSSNIGVFGESSSDYGVSGSSVSGSGVHGSSSSGYGVFGETSAGIGVWGNSQTRGVVGTLGGSSCSGTYGVGGCATSGDGVVGRAADGRGVVGSSDTGTGVYGLGGSIGVLGDSTARGVIGTLGGTSCAGTYGVGGCSVGNIGVFGQSSSNIGVFGRSATGSAVWGESTDGYSAEFHGGNAGTGYCYFAGGAGWSCTSDRNAKENFQPVDTAQVLKDVVNLPITTWNMKGDANQTPHMGPVAQDFYTAFSLGDSDTTINTADAQGVALAAIQGLYQLVQEQQEKIAELEARLAELE